ncbi:undecaprenyl/decaprenyl-phosphate alpha-N-acetylglucosaminyl 1-phosphate transferase [Patescibacteria group bacterium]|nr:undecaprenyl/decaprenyl-phosphate alpha-N-acetylglucosaminyl 1-phosphate transferase [Patescibacteria group bacterium]MBU4069107.1 undecaprenyl/decaprenyl-phosphate alpha-N-acetylglucosaminyl 1-phosphate transferase [Pseudomonadota bacterium]MBU4126111.1 undecaprenyl/decaprenyl-phosphate alpha-N-acetylglucosaminyl 1-phosphate transferase [Pseudomonadota bacterium]
MIYFSTLLISMFITIALIPVFRRLAVRVKVLDYPGDRKVHDRPMPKSGGIAMALGVLIPVLLWTPADKFAIALLIGAGIVVLLGLVDDFKDLGYKAKFAGQIAAAIVVILYGGVKIKSLGMLLPVGVLLPDLLAIPLTLIVIVGVTNAINLADGLDGLAGGICILSFLCIAYLAYCGGNTVIAMLSIAIAGAIFGFLRFNTYPATVFMGDAGSQFLGFTAITLSLKLTQGNTPLSPILPLILLGFPVFDTVTVMCERAAKRRSLFMADKNHLHHKLIRLGLFHTEAVFTIYIIQAFLVSAAFLFRFYSEWLLLFGYIIFSGLILLGLVAADRSGFKFKRHGLLDRVIKGKLKELKEKQVFIKASFRAACLLFIALMLFSCFLPKTIPAYLSFSAIAFGGMLLVTRLAGKQWMAGALRITIYLLVIFVIYLGEANMAVWMNGQARYLYNLSFGVMALFVILTLRLSRRTMGLRITPMDFLIIFIAMVVPNLPDEQIQSYNMGLLAAKIIVFFFSCDVLMLELRARLDQLGLATVAALGVIAVRGLVF